MTVFRLCSITVEDSTGNDLQNESYQYDETFNIIKKTTDDGNYEYTYDKINRLINANQPQPLQNRSYQYDDVGNRTGTEVEGQVWNYNANHELLNYGTEDNQVTFEYDQNGSTVKKVTTVMDDGSAGNAGAVTSAATETYVYNIAGRLTKVIRNGTTIAQYYYDPFGRRLYKDVSGTKTYFLYSREGLIGEYDATGALIKSYQYFPNHYWGTEPLALIEGGEAYFYQHDQLGTPNLLTSKTGEIQWKGLVGAYGEMNSIFSKLDNSLGLPGQFVDDETGLSYNLKRYYNTAVGRYFKADPIGLSGGINFYNYVHSMPTRLIDPLGLAAIQKCDGLEPNDECNFLRSRIIRKHLELTKELAKYDPVSDAIGGHKMKYGSGKTKPYGHYTEINNLQKGIKNDIQSIMSFAEEGAEAHR